MAGLLCTEVEVMSSYGLDVYLGVLRGYTIARAEYEITRLQALLHDLSIVARVVV